MNNTKKYLSCQYYGLKNILTKHYDETIIIVDGWQLPKENKNKIKIQKGAKNMMKRISVIMLTAVLAVNMLLGGVPVASAQDVSDESAEESVEESAKSQSIIYDRDDFDTFEEYEQYAKKMGIPVQYQTKSGDASVSGTTGTAVVYAPKSSLAYTIKNLKIAKAIQKTYIRNDYIYVLQRDGKDMILSKCKISGSEATKESEMTLYNFGHSQTLEWFEYGGKEYFWIACNASGAG